jgi:ribosomal protein L20A (L18A)
MNTNREIAKLIVESAREAGVEEHEIEEWATDHRVTLYSIQVTDREEIEPQAVRDIIMKMVG